MMVDIPSAGEDRDHLPLVAARVKGHWQRLRQHLRFISRSLEEGAAHSNYYLMVARRVWNILRRVTSIVQPEGYAALTAVETYASAESTLENRQAAMKAIAALRDFVPSVEEVAGNPLLDAAQRELVLEALDTLECRLDQIDDEQNVNAAEG